MRNIAIKFLVILSLGLVGLQFGLTGASAEQPEGKGKSDPIPELSLPYGIEKKYEFNADTGYTNTTGKNVPDKFASQVANWNTEYLNGRQCVGADCPGNVTNNSAAAIVVCPTSLTDEEMRLCLGLPAVKKAVRVKRLNVQLGQAQ